MSIINRLDELKAGMGKLSKDELESCAFTGVLLCQLLYYAWKAVKILVLCSGVCGLIYIFYRIGVS